jgi:putative Mg2+ transporter-C (MgtC) family protein
MEHVSQEILGSMPDARQLARVTVRLLLALIVGAVIGLQRELTGKAAGLRTHMLVALGTTLFVVAVSEMGMREDALSRVIQGIVTGIGFLGAGTILKLTEEQRIRGLTTAAGIWMTAAASIAIGVGQIAAALIGSLLAWFVLAVLWRLERHVAGIDRARDNQ